MFINSLAFTGWLGSLGLLGKISLGSIFNTILNNVLLHQLDEQ